MHGGRWATSLVRSSVVLAAALTGLSGCGSDQPSTRDTFSPSEITLKESGKLKELVDEKLTFVDSHGVEWVAPQGTLTDGATVPRIALPVTDGRFADEFLKAAVVHDAYCQKENRTRTPTQYCSRPWQQIHRMFYEACLAGGTAPLLAKVMYAAVWLAGPKCNDTSAPSEKLSNDALTRAFIGSKKWIEDKDPSVSEIEADLNQRGGLAIELSGFESGIQQAIEENDSATAQALLEREQRLLATKLESAPEDLMLLNYQGHMQINKAVLDFASQNASAAEAAIGNAEQSFRAVTAYEPREPAALNGLGSVSVLRGDRNQAEMFLMKVRQIAPSQEMTERKLRVLETARRPQRPE